MGYWVVAGLLRTEIPHRRNILTLIVVCVGHFIPKTQTKVNFGHLNTSCPRLITLPHILTPETSDWQQGKKKKMKERKKERKHQF